MGNESEGSRHALVSTAIRLRRHPKSQQHPCTWHYLAPRLNILARKFARYTVSRIACKSFGSLLGLSTLILTSNSDAVAPSSTAGWGLIAGIAFVTALFSQLLYNVDLPVIGATKTAMAGSIKLPTMFVVGWLAFGEDLNASFYAGVAVVSRMWNVSLTNCRARNRPGIMFAIVDAGYGLKLP